MYEPPYTPGPSGLRYKACCTSRLHRLLSTGDRAGAVELFLSVTGVPADMIARMRRAPLWSDLLAMARTLAYDDAILGTGAIPAARFASVTARTLVICGGSSPTPSRLASRALADALPAPATAP